MTDNNNVYNEHAWIVDKEESGKIQRTGRS